jgi:hypothetical protein
MFAMRVAADSLSCFIQFGNEQFATVRAANAFEEAALGSI